jgi:hypothetical protein
VAVSTFTPALYVLSTTQHVLQLGTYEGRAFTRFDVLKLGDLPQLAVDHQDKPVLEVGSRCHAVYLLQDGQFF